MRATTIFLIGLSSSLVLFLFGLARGQTATVSLRPLGLPQSNQRLPTSTAVIELGRRLFVETRLSADGQTSCATCHRPDRAFADGRRVARGTNGRAGTRNTPSLLNSGLMRELMWDGRQRNLEDQVMAPLLNPVEQGVTDLDASLAQLEQNPSYTQAFEEAFPSNSSSGTNRTDQVRIALSSFVRNLMSGDTGFDRYQYGKNSAALSAEARRGLELFRGRAQCTICHTISNDDALFTDQAYHTAGIGLERVRDKLPELTQRAVMLASQGRNLDATVLNDADLAELGRFLVTLDPKDIGRFRTPSLRNVAFTAPYMHDGSIATLEEAVDKELYYRSFAQGRPLILTPSEKTDLVEFLKAITDEKIHHP